MVTLKQVKAKAQELQATVEDNKDSLTHECRVQAPHRKLWACDDLHELVDCANRPWKPDYDDLLIRMNYGLIECTDPECDWCNE